MSASACWWRIKAFEEAGIIRGYRADVEPSACGLDFHAILQIRLTHHSPDTVSGFVEAVRTRPEILDCLATTGHADYHLRIRCANLDAYNDMKERFISRTRFFTTQSPWYRFITVDEDVVTSLYIFPN